MSRLFSKYHSSKIYFVKQLCFGNKNWIDLYIIGVRLNDLANSGKIGCILADFEELPRVSSEAYVSSDLYLYKYENVCLCVFVYVCVCSRFSRSFGIPFGKKLLFGLAKDSKTIIFQKSFFPRVVALFLYFFKISL